MSKLMKICRSPSFVVMTTLLVCMSHLSHANECTFKRISVPTVCGQVLDVLNKPIDTAEISVLTKATRVAVAGTQVDANGMFTMKPVAKGEYLLQVTGPGWDTLVWPMRVSGGKACKRLIVVSLAPKTGMGCFSGLTVKRNKPHK